MSSNPNENKKKELRSEANHIYRSVLATDGIDRSSILEHARHSTGTRRMDGWEGKKKMADGDATSMTRVESVCNMFYYTLDRT